MRLEPGRDVCKNDLVDEAIDAGKVKADADGFARSAEAADVGGDQRLFDRRKGGAPPRCQNGRLADA
jgi:hypothetical protein